MSLRYGFRHRRTVLAAGRGPASPRSLAFETLEARTLLATLHGDFDANGADDLVVGVPGEDVGKSDAGAVNVIYGESSGMDRGLNYNLNQLWYKGQDDGLGTIDGTPATRDGYGTDFAVGDFDQDGFDDLAAGIPGDAAHRGAVNILYGGANIILYGGTSPDYRLSTHRQMTFDQGTSGIIGSPEKVDRFAAALAAGDFNGDQLDDLAVGVPLEDVVSNTVVDAGAVNVIYDVAGTGLQATGDQIMVPGEDNLQQTPQHDDRFGEVLAVGNFNGDAYEDLAIGVPRKDIAGQEDAGGVHVIYGSSQGLTRIGSRAIPDDQFLYQGATLIVGTIRGSAEAFNGDGYDDLAIGTPFEDIDSNSSEEAGSVNIVYGSSSGLCASCQQEDELWTQNSSNIAGVAEPFDHFGMSLAAGNFNRQLPFALGFGDTFDDLAVGVPGEDINGSTLKDAGAVNVIYGSLVGLQSGGAGPDNQLWDQDDSELSSSDLTVDDPTRSPLVLRGSKSKIYRLRISPDGRWLVTWGGTLDKTPHIWDLNANYRKVEAFWPTHIM